MGTDLDAKWKFTSEKTQVTAVSRGTGKDGGLWRRDRRGEPGLFPKQICLWDRSPKNEILRAMTRFTKRTNPNRYPT